MIGVSRLQPEVNNVRSGIRLVEIGTPLEDDFVYKAPIDEINCKPTGLAVGWRKESIAVAWKEYGYDKKRNTVKFLSLNPKRRDGVPVDLELKGMSHMAVCPFGKEHWLLACAARPADLDPTDRSSRELKEIYLLLLDSSGAVLRRTPPLKLSFAPMFSYVDSIHALSLINTPEGPTIAYVDTKVGKRMGAYVALLTTEMEVKRVVRIDDSKQMAFVSHTHIASNGKALCAAWIQRNNELFVRAFSMLGDPLSDPHMIAKPAGVVARPAPIPEGFVIAWTDMNPS
jgi:hypothetical protein